MTPAIKKGTVTNVVASWPLRNMIAEGLLPRADTAQSTRIHESVGSGGLFGTFADYLMRKMIADLRGESPTGIRGPDRQEASELICERVPVSQKYRKEIETYKDPRVGWRDCLQEMWLMSHIDFVFRSKRNVDDIVHHPMPATVAGLSVLGYMERLARRFATARTVYYNPRLYLGSPRESVWVHGDADLVTEFPEETVLVDWKTAKNMTLNKDIAQTTLYMLLADTTEGMAKVDKVEIHYLMYEEVAEFDRYDTSRLVREYLT
jgi:hypothetical protein